MEGSVLGRENIFFSGRESGCRWVGGRKERDKYSKDRGYRKETVVFKEEGYQVLLLFGMKPGKTAMYIILLLPLYDFSDGWKVLLKSELFTYVTCMSFVPVNDIGQCFKSSILGGFKYWLCYRDALENLIHFFVFLFPYVEKMMIIIIPSSQVCCENLMD